MTAVFCKGAPDRKAETWGRQLRPFGHLEFAVSDAASGIARAVADLAEARRDVPQAPTLEHGLDIFHAAMEAHLALSRQWRHAEAAWGRAEAADAKLAEAKRRGIDARGAAQAARSAWPGAIASFEGAECQQAAWARAHAALDLFRVDGRLNDRRHAESEIAEALRDLTGPDWSKVRHFLNDPRSLSFLDRMHRRLELAEPRAPWREAMAWRWWLSHRRASSPDRLTRLIRAVGRDRDLDESERASSDRVSAVLRDTFRASSAVECMNSVLRMQQSRHKRMTQPMLDLKRLYWNCHGFRSGPRREACPYRMLGLDLPTFDFWELLQVDAEELAQRLSTARNAA
jgi:hypothetical protein